MMDNFDYNDSTSERKLIKKTLLKLLPKNNLEKFEEIPLWSPIIFEEPFECSAEILKVVSTVFVFFEKIEHRKALEIIKEAQNKNIRKFDFCSEKAEIKIKKNVQFLFYKTNKLKDLINEFKEILENGINDFVIHSGNISLSQRNDKTIQIFKENYAKTDFLALKELSQFMEEKIEYFIKKEEEKFIVNKDKLEIKTDKNEEDILKKYKELNQYFKSLTIITE